MEGPFELLSERYSPCHVLSPLGSLEKHRRAVLTLGISLQDAYTVIKLHGFDVERRQDAFLVLQRSIINIILIG